MRKMHLAALVAILVGLTAAVAMADPGEQTGPSTSQSPYLLRSQPGVITRSILTVGDSVNAKPSGDPYRMVGIPDGLGAFDNGNGTFTLLVNHELPGNGIVRAHGSAGAFVSKWTIENGSLRVLHGEDLAHQLMLWNGSGYTPGTSLIQRLCSADLAAPSAFFNTTSGKGYDGRLYLDGEEVSTGRAWAHELNGTSWQLPYLGQFAWENAVASPSSGDRTVVVGLDDTTPGQVYVYVGDKQSSGSPVVKAGLSGGTLYGIKVPGVPTEADGTVLASGTRFELASIGSGDVSTKTAAQIETDSNTALVTRFLRPEDGSWDPTNAHVFYFVTTNAFDRPSKLWRLTFDDPANPTAGVTIETVLDGTEGQHMFDNITVNDRGQVLLQEDVGNNAHLGKVWIYSPAADTLTEIAHHDPARFVSGAPGFLTQDEESSGVIPAPFLGDGWYLLDVQAHYATGDSELVEGGQLLALHVPPGKF